MLRYVKYSKFSEIIIYKNTYTSTLYEGISLDAMCKTVTKENLKGKIFSLKAKIEAGLEPELRNIKDTISLCWDKDNKKFIKPKNVENRIFNAIKDTRNSVQWKKMLKYGGITAGVFEAVSLVYSMLNYKPNIQEN